MIVFLGTLKYVSKIEEYQVYGALIPKEMLNEDILNSTAYHTYYAYASGAKEPKKARKFKKHASPKLKTISVSPKEPIKKSAKKSEPNKALSKGKIIKGIEILSNALSDVALTEATQLKEGCPDEKQRKISCTDGRNLVLNLEEAHADMMDYIDLIDTSVRAIIKEEVNSQLLHILPQAVLEFATPVIVRNITESLEAAILAKSSSQPNSTYEAAASLSEFELKKILMDKMESAHAEEQSHTVDDSRVRQNQKFDTGNNDEQPDDEAISKSDCNIARVEKPPTSFDELMDTPIDFFAFVMNRLNIKNLTQELLVGPAFNLLKGTCKSCTELKYHFEECFKATSERLDWHNPEGKQYSFDLRKPLLLIANHQVTSLKIMKRYDYGHLDEIEVRREDRQLYKFKEGDFP
ncbi:hypothetical protein Tco_0468266 [Tanacetum coccineum]